MNSDWALKMLVKTLGAPSGQEVGRFCPALEAWGTWAGTRAGLCAAWNPRQAPRGAPMVYSVCIQCPSLYTRSFVGISRGSREFGAKALVKGSKVRSYLTIRPALYQRDGINTFTQQSIEASHRRDELTGCRQAEHTKDSSAASGYHTRAMPPRRHRRQLPACKRTFSRPADTDLVHSPFGSLYWLHTLMVLTSWGQLGGRLVQCESKTTHTIQTMNPTQDYTRPDAMTQLFCDASQKCQSLLQGSNNLQSLRCGL